MDFTRIFLDMTKPQVFTKSPSVLWDDEHISKGMLAAHLDPAIDGASRKHQFIDASVEWIVKRLGLKKESRLLDLGCGPGLYAERFALKGCQVTGVDFSKRSIQYGTESANKKALDIEYRYMNYLDLTFENEFDCIIMIYCDFGVLSDEERAQVLKNVYRALKPGGHFVFDVFTQEKYVGRKEENHWQKNSGGFWREGDHICLEAFYNYPEQDVFLEQYIILEEDGHSVYRNWNRVYNRDSIESVLLDEKLIPTGIYGDIGGRTYDEKSDTICMIAKKHKK